MRLTEGYGALKTDLYKPNKLQDSGFIIRKYLYHIVCQLVMQFHGF